MGGVTTGGLSLSLWLKQPGEGCDMAHTHTLSHTHTVSISLSLSLSLYGVWLSVWPCSCVAGVFLPVYVPLLPDEAFAAKMEGVQYICIYDGDKGHRHVQAQHVQLIVRH